MHPKTNFTNLAATRTETISSLRPTFILWQILHNLCSLSRSTLFQASSKKQRAKMQAKDGGSRHSWWIGQITMQSSLRRPPTHFIAKSKAQVKTSCTSKIPWKMYQRTLRQAASTLHRMAAKSSSNGLIETWETSRPRAARMAETRVAYLRQCSNLYNQEETRALISRTICSTT